MARRVNKQALKAKTNIPRYLKEKMSRNERNNLKKDREKFG